MKDFFDYQLYIFDLDNTLYSENDYLFGAYEAIGIALGRDEAPDFLKTTFLKEGRANLFDKLEKQFLLDENTKSVCLEILRTYKPTHKFKIYPDVLHLLNQLKAKNKQLALLTNGTPVQQRNKIENVEPLLSDYFFLIVLANEIARKPSPESVTYILNQTGISKAETIMIGDDRNDEVTAENSGVDYIYIDKLRKELI